MRISDWSSDVCSSDLPNAHTFDSLHPQFLEVADEIIDTALYTDEELDERIRHDKIDILVDLTGPQRENRLLVYTMKPAPIQVMWGEIGRASCRERVCQYV